MLVLNADTGVSMIQDNTVTSAKVVDGEVSNAKLAPNAVTSDKIADGSLGIADMLETDWTNSKTTNGYTKLPNGIIIQWGTSGSVGGGGTVGVTLPIAFPSACAMAVASQNQYTAAGSAVFAVTAKSTTSISITAGITSAFYWIAIGY